jgi:hypothetical protein
MSTDSLASLTTAQAIDNLAESTQEIANELYNMQGSVSQFNGYSIADSLGFIADAMVKIAEAYSKETDQ